MQGFSRCSSAVPRSWGRGFINQPVGCIIIACWQIGLSVLNAKTNMFLIAAVNAF